MTPIELNKRQFSCVNMKELVEIEEYKKVKQALETITAERDTLLVSLETEKLQCRKNIIQALTEGIHYKDAETRSSVVESFHRSKLSIQEINELLEPMRHITITQDRRISGIS